MATFTPMNFPKIKGFPKSGERTQYAPLSKTDVRYKQGFPTAKSTALISNKGVLIKTLEKGAKVHFTFPPTLVTGSQIGIKQGQSSKQTFAAVSLKGVSSKVDGYILLSHVEKPSGGAQARVGAGAQSQKLVNEQVQKIASNHGKSYQFVSSAQPGSTKPDLVVKYDDVEVQFEIKGSSGGTSSLITLFDVSIGRNHSHPFADLLVPLFLKHGTIDLYRDPKSGKRYATTKTVKLSTVAKGISSMTDLVDYYQHYGNPETGFPGDRGVIKSGKLPKEFEVTNEDFLASALELIKHHFAENSDNYFAVHFRGLNQIKMYYTGHGKNLLKLPELPKLKFFGFMTYGGVSGGKMRSGIKVKFDF